MVSVREGLRGDGVHCELYAVAGNPTFLGRTHQAGSAKINEGNIITSSDGTMFAGIQHPAAPFPDGEGSLPRSTVVAVTRVDGALVG